MRLSLVQHLPLDDPYRIHAPCPFVTCRFHLHVDIGNGGITVYNGRSIEHTCALDVADREPNGLSHESIAELMDLTAEGVRLTELRSLELLRKRDLDELRELAEDDFDDADADGGRVIRWPR